MAEVSGTQGEAPRESGSDRACKKKMIHPIVIYPYTHPEDTEDVKYLYTELIAKLVAEPDRYHRPITVMNQQTFYSNASWRFDDEKNIAFRIFCQDIVEEYSEVVFTWAVDTCQMWLAGLGKAFDRHKEDHADESEDDVYWVIPGDFNYKAACDLLDKSTPATVAEGELFRRIKGIPNAVFASQQDFCMGEIKVRVDSSKQLIDTYGTYGLLYNWFPHEAQLIRKITAKPRSEFFAMSHSFLKDMLGRRWYAYEQTIVFLLQGVAAHKRMAPVELAELSDLPQGRDTLAAAMQQVERTERMLKLFWREDNSHQQDWIEQFKKLDAQSSQIRGAAMVILGNLLS